MRIGTLALPESFDSPVIYGVRVETSNPYHLFISNISMQLTGSQPEAAFLRWLYYISMKQKSQAEILAFFTFFATKICIVSTIKAV
jgi:hypothetical protein